MHSVKIEDKLYEKLKAYCDLNDTTVFKVSNAAIEDYLNNLMFGDAPFMVQPVVKEEPKEIQQISQEEPVNLEKNTEKEETLLEKIEKNEVTVIDSVKSDEQGNVEIRMKKTDGINHIETQFTVHNDGTVEIGKENIETPQRPRKRRL